MSASLLWLGESRPCNLVYYLGLDAHLVVRGIAVRWGMGMYSAEFIIFIWAVFVLVGMYIVTERGKV